MSVNDLSALLAVTIIAVWAFTLVVYGSSVWREPLRWYREWQHLRQPSNPRYFSEKLLAVYAQANPDCIVELALAQPKQLSLITPFASPVQLVQLAALFPKEKQQLLERIPVAEIPRLAGQADESMMRSLLIWVPDGSTIEFVLCLVAANPSHAVLVALRFPQYATQIGAAARNEFDLGTLPRPASALTTPLATLPRLVK